MFLATALFSDHGEEHPWLYYSRFAQLQVLRVLFFQKPIQIVREGKYTSVAVLCRPGVNAYFSRFEIDVAPLQRQNLRRDSPAGDVGELDGRTNRRR